MFITVFRIQKLYIYAESAPIPPISGSHNQSKKPINCTTFKNNSS